MRQVSKLLDAALITVVFVSSTSVAYTLLSPRRLNTLFDQLAPAVLSACGHGLVAPLTPAPALEEFRRHERLSLSCADVDAIGPVRTLDEDVMSTRYAVYAVAFAFRIGGIAWRTIDAYLALVFGLSMTLAYALFRLVAGRVLSAIGVALLVFSPHALGVALPYRDFSKEFWFLAGWLGIGVLLRRGASRASPAIYLPAIATGVALGLGLGFRVDMAIIVLAVVAVILFGLRGFTWPAVKAKTIAVSAFLLSYVVCGAPILMTFAAGSSPSHVIVLGLLTPFTEALGLDSPPYDFGNLYSDDFATETIHAHALLADHDTVLAPYKSRAYDRQGISLLKDAVRHFPADFVARGLGAARQVLVDPFGPQSSVAWLRGYELVLVAAAFLAVAVRDRRLAVVMTMLVLYFSSYSMLQFSRRHTFHLDTIAIGVMLVALAGATSLVARLWRERRAGRLRGVLTEWTGPAARGAGIGVVLWSVAFGGLTLLRLWQQPHVTRLFERALAAPSVEMAMMPEPLAPPLQSGWPTAVLLRPAKDAWPPGRIDVLHAEYLIIEVGGARCAADIVSIMLKYSVVPGTPYENLRRTYDLHLGYGLRLLVPIIEMPGATRFDGLAMPGALAGCVRSVRRVNPPDAVPLPNVFAVLGAGWRSAPLYQRLRDAPAGTGALSIVLTGQH